MHCIPEEPEFGDGQAAEKAVWELLRKSLPDDVVLAHSVQVRNGNAQHEIDLLVLWPGVGLAAVEVKGGLVRIENGQWYQSAGTGFKARRAVAKLDARLPNLDRKSARHTAVQPLRVYGCSALHTCATGLVQGGIPRTLILDDEDVMAPADRIRLAIEEEGGGISSLAPSYLQRIAGRLAGTLTPENTQEGSAREIESLQEPAGTPYRPAGCTVIRNAFAPPRPFHRRSRQRQDLVGGRKGTTAGQGRQARRVLLLHQRTRPIPTESGGGLAPGQTSFHRRIPRVRAAPRGASREGPAYFEEDMPRMLKELAGGLPEIKS